MTVQEFRNLLLVPTLIFLAVVTLLEVSAGDLLIADWLFRFEGGSWQLRSAWITNDLIHDRGRYFVAFVLLIVAAAIALSYLVQALRPYRAALYYVLAAALVSVAVVNLLKAITHVDCPWDLARYGGEKTYVSLFGSRPENQEPGRCFPAGHASGAYCWLGLFYFARRHFPKLQKFMLAGVIIAGLVFGVAQQLRGAHFLSHDIWTVFLCWMAATLCYFFVFRLATTAPLPHDRHSPAQ